MAHLTLKQHLALAALGGAASAGTLVLTVLVPLAS
jgi:hypothetical protein